MSRRNALAAFVLLFAVGCGSTAPTGSSGKDVEDQQNAEQKKADDEEREENKARSTKGKKQK